MKTKPRLLRITTVPVSLKLLLRGQLEFMTQQGFDVLAVSASGPEIKSLNAQGIKHEVVHMTRKITPLSDLLALFKLIALIRSFKPDIVHTHTPKAGLLGMMAAWICRIPVRLHTVAGLPLMESHGIKRKVLIATERISYACATKVYPNSLGLKRFIESAIYQNMTKVELIGRGSSNGIDSTFFSRSPELNLQASQIRNQYSITSSEIVFCFVGRIVRDKGINELVEAFEKLSVEFPSRLILVGPFEDDLDPVSAKTQHSIKTNSKIHSLGFQPDVRPSLSAADVFVFPSYREGFPNVVMQACCMELPCIVSDINGCNEIIQDRVTGLIVAPKKVDQLYDAMKFMAAHKTERQQFGIRSREFVAQNFDQSYLWSRIAEEYTKQMELCTRVS